MITVNEPQVWTLIGVFAAIMLGLITIITRNFTQTLSANFEVMSTKFDAVNERIDGLGTEMRLRFE